MSLTSPARFSRPFADTGNKRAIPDGSQIGIEAGAASLEDGFPPLTFLPIAAGGTPVDGRDMNGILNEITASERWTQAGMSFAYDATFATAIGGYPVGARLPRSDANGFWVNSVANNTIDPEGAGTGWSPADVVGAVSITMTSSNVTLSALQSGFDIIVLTGVLTSNLNLVVKNYVKNYTILNQCTGSYAVTVKTASGTGVSVATTKSKNVACDGVNVIELSGAGGATGAGADAIFNLNGQTVTANYTIPTGQNAMTAGSISINDGVTVTIPDGSTWVVV